MFCEKCGAKGLPDAKFCEQCGAPLEDRVLEEVSPVSQDKHSHDPLIQTTGVIEELPHMKAPAKSVPKALHRTAQPPLSQDVPIENREWLYEFSLWKNPAILITTGKVLLIGLSAPTLLMFLLTLSEAGLQEALRVAASILGIGLIVMAVLLLLGYALTGLIQGGKYIVLFQMDKEGINHIQLQPQHQKAQAMGFLTALTGVVSGNLSVAGAGLMAATKRNLYTPFRNVKSVKLARSRHTIYLNETLAKNQVYAAPEDYDIILQEILARCPRDVKISGQ